MAGHLRDLRFGQMAFALGFIELPALCEAMVELGRQNPAGGLPELLEQGGQLAADQAAAVQHALAGEPPGNLLTDNHYELGQELARGAFGRILRARDRHIGRQVAIKALLPEFRDRPDAISRFILEARVAGQLTHPNTVPVYELGAMDGVLYYAMKEVHGETLADAVELLRSGKGESTYPLARLVGYLRQVCQAVVYAHDQGVIHRDIKPHNVMIGSYGEVFLLDWGSAKLIGSEDEEEVSTDLDADLLGTTAASVMTRAGKVKGTPAYMAPEQALAESDRIGPSVDVYALGAVLYELLCLQPPFSGNDIDQVLENVVGTTPLPPRSRAPLRSIPVELEEAAMSCLRKDPDDRPESARRLIEILDEFLLGTRRQEEAEASLKDAETALERYEDLVVQVAQAERETLQARAGEAPWTPVEEKRGGWKSQRKRVELSRAREEAFNLALVSYERALGNDPDNGTARQGLAELYWRKFEEAEGRGDEEATEFFRTQVLHFDDGEYRREFSGMARFSVHTDPPGATAVLYRCEEQDRMLVPSLPRVLGRTPTATVRMAQGAYVLTLELEGYARTNLSLFSNRPGARTYHVRMRTADELGEDFRFIPAGRFLRGGDPRVPESWPRKAIYVPDFAIARHPVTFAEYLEFLDDIASKEGRAALARAPRADARGRRLVRWDADRERVRFDVRPEYGEGCQQWPVFSISFDDAVAYAEWRSEREGREVRLPTELEWEKAARGVDGRLYPWGDEFEPTYCNCRTSRADRVSVMPVGSFRQDISPYGVSDLAGGVMEWCADTSPGDPQVRRVRGGAWNREGRDCSSVVGRSMPLWTTGTAIGMRLVMPLLGTSGAHWQSVR